MLGGARIYPAGAHITGRPGLDAGRIEIHSVRGAQHGIDERPRASDVADFYHGVGDRLSGRRDFSISTFDFCL